jgi:hypothetical protein
MSNKISNIISDQELCKLLAKKPQKAGLEQIRGTESGFTASLKSLLKVYKVYYLKENPKVKIAITNDLLSENTDSQWGYAYRLFLVAVLIDGEKPTFLVGVRVTPNDNEKACEFMLYDGFVDFKTSSSDSSRKKRAQLLSTESIYWWHDNKMREEVNFAIIDEEVNPELLINGGYTYIKVKGSGDYHNFKVKAIPIGWTALYEDITENDLVNKFTTEELERIEAERKAERLRKEEERKAKKEEEQQRFATEHPTLAKFGISQKMLNLGIAILIIALLIYMFG